MLNNNILFIIPPHGPYDSYIPKVPGQKKYFLTPPYGVLSLISYINIEKKYNIEIIDCNKIILENLNELNIEELVLNIIKDTILKSKPYYIGISALFNTSFSHVSLAKKIKEYYKDGFIFLGGGLATHLYKELLEKFPEIDAICFGEGEVPLKKLLDCKEIVNDISRISPAWITKESILRNQKPQYELIENLDDIPIIDFSYIDLKKYNGRSYIDKSNSELKIEVSIHTSRGCPFMCIFCSNRSLHGKKVRMMSLEKVLETIKTYKEKYGMTILLVEDDHFLYNKERALKVLQYIKENNINVEFSNGISVSKIDDDIAKALSDARIKLITLAIESGCDYVLKKVMNKPLTVKKIKEVVSILKKYNMRIHAFLVIGIPGEFDKHRKETLDLLVELELDWIYVFIATPIAGSRLFDICKENNYLIDDSFDNHVVTKCNIKAPGIDPKEIEEWAYYINTIVNFIKNSNIKRGRFEIAEEYFLNVLKSYPKQAIAYYMMSKIYKNSDKYNYYYNKYLEFYEEHLSIYKNSIIWKNLFESDLKLNV